MRLYISWGAVADLTLLASKTATPKFSRVSPTITSPIFTYGEARRSMDHNWPSFVRPFESSQESLYRPEKHWNIGNWGHWVQFWGQPWPLWSFGGHIGLRGHQDGRQRQYAHKYQGGNTHMDTRVIRVAGFKSEVKWPLRSLRGHHGLGGHWRQYTHGYQGNQGCWFQIWSQMTSKII